MLPNMLLYRLAGHYPTKARGLDLWRGANNDIRAFVSAEPLTFALVNYDDNGRPRLLTYTVPDKLPSVKTMAQELLVDENTAQGRVDRPFSDHELMAAVMAKGKTYSYYGSLVNLELEHVHLFACGINWNLYRGVTHSSWTQFTDTFSEPSEDEVMEVDVECRCGKVSVRFGLEPPSIATLFLKLSAEQLDSLFSDE